MSAAAVKVKRGKWKYQLTDDHAEIVPIHVDRAGGNVWVQIEPADEDLSLLRIRAGYVSDGPSGPTIDSTCAMTAAIVHDALYQLMSECVVGADQRAAADALLRDRCIADGMPRWRAWLWYAGVRLFGWRHCRPR